jgi:AcrR family transcriptional regulator
MPSTLSRRAQNAEGTRKALLAAARALFASHGYARTGTEDVVRRARVTRGALYHHFRDKQALFEAVVHQEEQKLAQRIATAAAGEADPWRGFVAGCQAFLDACLDPAVRRIVVLDGPTVLSAGQQREVEELYYLRGIKRGLGSAMAAGLIDDLPLDALARALLGALTQAAQFIASADNDAAARTEAEAAVMRLLEGLKPRGALISRTP